MSEMRTIEEVRIKVAEELQKRWLDVESIKGWLAGVGKIPQAAQKQIAEVVRSLFAEYGLRPDLGHIVILGDRPYVTREGLLYYARKSGQLMGIQVEIVERTKGFCLVKATVLTKDGGRFEAFGDASTDNTNRMVSPHLIRMAETRAINRALREAFPIGLCSYEELSEEDVRGGNYGGLDYHISGSNAPATPTTANHNAFRTLDKKYISGIHAWSQLANFDYKAYIKEKFKKESSKDLTPEEAKEVIMKAKEKWREDILSKEGNPDPCKVLEKDLRAITYKEAREFTDGLTVLNGEV